MLRLSNHQGSALVLLISAIAIGMALSLAYLNRSSVSLFVAGVRNDQLDAQYQMESAFEKAKGRLNRAVEGITAIDSVLAAKSYSSVVADYGEDEEAAMDFLKEAVEIQAEDINGQADPDHEFYSFEGAFHEDWKNLDSASDHIMQARYKIIPLPPDIQTGSFYQTQLKYEYVIDVRGYGEQHFSEVASSETGVITVNLRQAPFSSYSIFRSKHTNQDGLPLYFAHGNTVDEFQEVHNGAIHINGEPHFYGHPLFLGLFSSSTPKEDWVQNSSSDYDCCAQFEAGYLDNIPSIDMPTQLANLERLASGDPDPTAATNDDPVSEDELVDFLQDYAGGSLSGSELPPGVYVPIDPVLEQPTGGVFVEGDARVKMNVVEGQGPNDIPSQYWSELSPQDQDCRYQKIHIQSMDDSTASRDIFVGDDPCEVTYVFEPSSSSAEKLDRRINGNIHVRGKIDELGGESRFRPAVAKDFGFNISAQGSVRIINDLQYEDAHYLQLDEDNKPTETIVATPWGELENSGYDPTSADIAPWISDDSKTVLGIVSTHSNVLLYHSDEQTAPEDLNVHAAIFAGNSASHNSATGLGCGSGSDAGCGFGYEGWDESNQGTFKLLGSISEHTSQTIGSITYNTGYSRRFTFDQRFDHDLTPPGYPLSDTIRAYPKIEPLKVWRLAGNE